MIFSQQMFSGRKLRVDLAESSGGDSERANNNSRSGESLFNTGIGVFFSPGLFRKTFCISKLFSVVASEVDISKLL